MWVYIEKHDKPREKSVILELVQLYELLLESLDVRTADSPLVLPLCFELDKILLSYMRVSFREGRWGEKHLSLPP